MRKEGNSLSLPYLLSTNLFSHWGMALDLIRSWDYVKEILDKETSKNKLVSKEEPEQDHELDLAE